MCLAVRFSFIPDMVKLAIKNSRHRNHGGSQWKTSPVLWCPGKGSDFRVVAGEVAALCTQWVTEQEDKLGLIAKTFCRVMSLLRTGAGCPWGVKASLFYGAWLQNIGDMSQPVYSHPCEWDTVS